MELHRFFFRLDFPSAFTLFNEWGNVLALLNSSSFWTELTDSVSPRAILARRVVQSGSELHSLTVEVNGIGGGFEAHPTNSPREYLRAFEDVSTVIAMLNVQEFKRVGVRFFFLEPTDSFKDGLDPLMGKVCQDYWQQFDDPPRDIAITSIHGGKDQSVRLAVGPISREEYRAWFGLPDRVGIENGIIVDVDCFAMAYKLKTFEFSKLVELYFDMAFAQAKHTANFLMGKE